jgi:predicted ABC-type transport system involved in lysophospholipase L1 biosynthesis ATPase subunit
VLLELEQVAKRYRRGTEAVVALDGVDLRVDEGEAVALVGPSGSGKSTLLHVAGGLDAPDAGRVRLDGRDLGRLSLRDRARLRRREVGFVFQFFHLLPSLSVAENVELPLLLDGGGGRRRGSRVGDVLDRVGLTHRAAHRPGELSGGEMQRAAIARAVVAGPRLVLADEPTGNLDSATGAGVLDLLMDLVRERGTAMVVVTHDSGVARRAGRVLHLRDGRLVERPTVGLAAGGDSGAAGGSWGGGGGDPGAADDPASEAAG